MDGTWRQALEAAGSEAHLLALARDYVESLPAECIDALPLPCRPRHLLKAGDVTLLTYQLKRTYCSAVLDPKCIPHIERLIAFFQLLSARLFERGIKVASAASAPPGDRTFFSTSRRLGAR